MKIVERVLSHNGVTTKYLQQTSDWLVVETTYINQPQKHILCVSTQVGCLIRCGFCASGLRRGGLLYQRSLTSAELVEQCRNITREIDFTAHPKPLLLSFMGEGEPFLNFDQCVEAFHNLTQAHWAVPLRLAVSTSGIRPDLIRRLSEIEFPVPLKLQVSLHGPTDDVRHQIVPVTKPVAEIVAATRAYREHCGQPVEWNYIMCAGVNDKLEYAQLLVELLGSGWHVKFNRLNSTIGSPFRSASREQVNQFRQILEVNGISTEYYETDESGIASGCGQLSYHFISLRG